VHRTLFAKQGKQQKEYGNQDYDDDDYKQPEQSLSHVEFLLSFLAFLLP
jgi:hypothetical protein